MKNEDINTLCQLTELHGMMTEAVHKSRTVDAPTHCGGMRKAQELVDREIAIIAEKIFYPKRRVRGLGLKSD